MQGQRYLNRTLYIELSQCKKDRTSIRKGGTYAFGEGEGCMFKRTLKIRGRASLLDDGGQRFDEIGVLAIAGEIRELTARRADTG